VRVYFVSVVVRALAPVVVHSEAPAALLRFSFARGNIVPTLAVLLIHSVKVTVDAAGITPDTFGTLLWVSNALTIYSPLARLFRLTEVKATVAASGPAALS
jgi:hypothetical protein